MNILIFAGGVGTRLWPLSRKNSPKQFEHIVNDKSTLQLAVARLSPAYKPQDMYISTNIQYVPVVQKQLHAVPADHIVGEPEMRDVGPAVGLMTAILMSIGPKEPMAILWCDHLVKNEALFRTVLQAGENIVRTEPDKIVFLAQKPRFASQNLGWIKFGDTVKKQNGISVASFHGLTYRPAAEDARRFFESGRYAWNLGYFVTTPAFLWKKFEQTAPDMFENLTKFKDAWNTSAWEKVLHETYPKLEKISFDNVLLEKLDHHEGYVISEDLQWSDVGAWEALKEAVETSPAANVTLGNVLVQDSSDSLVYNYHNKQLVVAIDMDEMLIVNTDDVLLVCKKKSVPKIKDTVNNLQGTKYEHLA
ncbi:MAG: hypothetical protein A2845_06320 [Candidatus Lloydbacteria bacterium RIFCSPHIGHO2_01_FULL_49_22]|uniref:Nucleotidyl transferase domain-containing protein n=1 Tax=Candidatus Lloydbacteria bacterium RIFCSPHIGHO2_01_FULL_49_22 TaxID=1798658 RepID=A0A1G2CXR6_9BACT|nr:MAG: hypothetical protein A2845_06320 [Candidatus Lloydbacteria bacterium RIFCSPHIGHO2_01_FULL_49_22]